MELFDKLTSLTVAAAERANNAIEAGRLSLKINSEESNILGLTLDIGELMVEKLDNGLDFDDDEIKALYASIQATRQTIADYQAEIVANRPAAEEKADPGEEGPVCSQCGAPLAPDARFCDQCGTKVEEEEPPAEEPEPQPGVCANCGAALTADSKFCNQCGTAVPGL